MGRYRVDRWWRAYALAGHGHCRLRFRRHHAVRDIRRGPATALLLLINASGKVSVHLMPLMTPEDVDAAATKAQSYRAPGS